MKNAHLAAMLLLALSCAPQADLVPYVSRSALPPALSVAQEAGGSLVVTATYTGPWASAWYVVSEHQLFEPIGVEITLGVQRPGDVQAMDWPNPDKIVPALDFVVRLLPEGVGGQVSYRWQRPGGGWPHSRTFHQVVFVTEEGGLVWTNAAVLET